MDAREMDWSFLIDFHWSVLGLQKHQEKRVEGKTSKWLWQSQFDARKKNTEMTVKEKQQTWVHKLHNLNQNLDGNENVLWRNIVRIVAGEKAR